jgi:DNA replication protein DnaC
LSRLSGNWPTWHEEIGDPTLANGNLDRLVHNAHRIEMRGDSMRKNCGKAQHMVLTSSAKTPAQLE